jgi:hypothetical protein
MPGKEGTRPNTCNKLPQTGAISICEILQELQFPDFVQALGPAGTRGNYVIKLARVFNILNPGKLSGLGARKEQGGWGEVIFRLLE